MLVGIYTTMTHVYVADMSNRQVQVFGQNGVFQFQFDSNGTGNGQFNDVWDVMLDDAG